MKAIWPSLLVLLSLIGCSSEQAAAPPPEKIEAMRQQYIEQARAFNAEPARGQKK